MSIKLVSLLSVGIDSPVAAYLMAESGADVFLLHLHQDSTGGDGDLEAIEEMAGKIGGYYDVHLTVAQNFGEVQDGIFSKVDRHLQCVLCRRMMYRVAERYADKHEAKGIVTGESMGQVASQTLSNLVTEDKAIEKPVYRPLIGLDKNEITEIAKDIGTYDISIQPSTGCSLTPEGPRIRSRGDEVVKEEKELDIEGLLRKIDFKRKY